MTDKNKEAALADFKRACQTGDAGDVSKTTYDTIVSALQSSGECEAVTADELMDRINRSHYNYLCMVEEIARVFPNGVKIIPSPTTGEPVFISREFDPLFPKPPTTGEK